MEEGKLTKLVELFPSCLMILGVPRCSIKEIWESSSTTDQCFWESVEKSSLKIITNFKKFRTLRKIQLHESSSLSHNLSHSSSCIPTILHDLSPILFADKPLFTFNETGDSVCIGRDKRTCKIVLPPNAPGVSREHLQLIYMQSGGNDVVRFLYVCLPFR